MDRARRALRAGAPDAIPLAIASHGPAVHARCAGALGDARLAREATLAVFLLLWRKARSLPPSVDLADWCRRAADGAVAGRARAGEATDQPAMPDDLAADLAALIARMTDERLNDGDAAIVELAAAADPAHAPLPLGASALGLLLALAAVAGAAAVIGVLAR